MADSIEYEKAKSVEKITSAVEDLARSKNETTEFLNSVDEFRKGYQGNSFAYEGSRMIMNFFDKRIDGLPLEVYVQRMQRTKPTMINEFSAAKLDYNTLTFALWRYSTLIIRGSSESYFNKEYLELKLLIILAEILDRKIDDLEKVIYKNQLELEQHRNGTWNRRRYL